MSLQPRDAVIRVVGTTYHRKGLICQRLEHFFERQHSGGMSRPLIGGAVRRDPLRSEAHALVVKRGLARENLHAPLVTGMLVCHEATIRFGWNLASEIAMLL